jgi:hypothetical protein
LSKKPIQGVPTFIAKIAKIAKIANIGGQSESLATSRLYAPVTVLRSSSTAGRGHMQRFAPTLVNVGNVGNVGNLGNV